jgi:hypothetical protein
MLFEEIITVYSEYSKESRNTLYGQDPELMNVKAVDM